MDKNIIINERRVVELYDIDNIVKLLPNEEAKKCKRQLREPLFEAFDKHKGNIEYGAETETHEEKQRILAWRNDLKDLKTEAFKDVPSSIKYYLKE